jgi:hypothetical protein
MACGRQRGGGRLRFDHDEQSGVTAARMELELTVKMSAAAGSVRIVLEFLPVGLTPMLTDLVSCP